MTRGASGALDPTTVLRWAVFRIAAVRCDSAMFAMIVRVVVMRVYVAVVSMRRGNVHLRRQ